MSENNLLSLKEIRNLAPEELPNYREERYRGGYFSGSLGAFSVDEQALIRAHYEQLTELMELVDPDRHSEQEQKPMLEHFLQHNELHQLAEQYERATGEAEADDDPHKARVIRRLSTGAFSSICWYLLIMRQVGVEVEYLHSLFYLTRDHLKAMRAFVRDLDPDKRAGDEAEIEHSVDLLTEKWESSIYRAYEGAVKVRFRNHYHGTVAERCVEFAELDRIFYLITHHSLEHAEDASLGITMAETEDEMSLRWAFVHKVGEETLAGIKQLSAEGISLFEQDPDDADGHFAETTTDLSFVGEAVAHAYGLPDLIAAVQQGYIGSQVEGNVLTLWFHWPRIGTL